MLRRRLSSFSLLRAQLLQSVSTSFPPVSGMTSSLALLSHKTVSTMASPLALLSHKKYAALALERVELVHDKVVLQTRVVVVVVLVTAAEGTAALGKVEQLQHANH